VNFQINNGENVLIQGRTGSGKSIILQLIAGFYNPDKGIVKVGGYEVENYDEENYYSKLFYIMQFNVIIEDTIRNNITRFNENYNDEEIYQALEVVNLCEWVRKECDNGLDTIINAGNISQDRAQLLAWAGVLLVKPKVLLVDECDSNIQDNTIKIIDDVINNNLYKTTIVMVTHKRRNSIKVDKEIKIEAGRIINIIDNTR
jgi:ATP-binding cassette subfamily B protein